jgi:hypothetical protein
MNITFMFIDNDDAAEAQENWNEQLGILGELTQNSDLIYKLSDLEPGTEFDFGGLSPIGIQISN